MAQQLAIKSKYQGNVQLTVDGREAILVVDNMFFPNDEN